LTYQQAGLLPGVGPQQAGGMVRDEPHEVQHRQMRGLPLAGMEQAPAPVEAGDW